MRSTPNPMPHGHVRHEGVRRFARQLAGVRLAGVLAATLFASAALAQSAAEGAWHGAVEIPGQPLEVRVVLAHDGDAWSGTIDIPAQGAADLPLDPVSVDGDAVRFTIQGLAGEPTFDGIVRDATIEGTFTQGGGEAPFVLTRSGDDAEADGGSADDPADASAASTTGDDGQRVASLDGRFDLPVPASWTADAVGDTGVTISGPDGAVRVHTFVVDAGDPDEAIARAWQRIDPGFDRDAVQSARPPASDGFDAIVQVTYTEPTADQLFQAVARMHDGVAYVTLIEGPSQAMQRRAAQVSVILTGLRVTYMETTELDPAKARGIDDAMRDDLRAYVRDAMERHAVPGAIVTVVQDGQVVFSGGFGRSAEGGTNVTPDTRMMIGSTTKTLTTLLLATLVDRGDLTWGTPVTQVLPDFALADPEITPTVTIEQLVCACTGVPRRDVELLFRHDDLDAETIVASLADFELFTEVGETFQYSNQMVAAGGYAAGVVATSVANDDVGLYERYLRAMQREVLEPVGMTASTFDFGEVIGGSDRGVLHAVPHALGPSLAYGPIDLADEAFVTPVAPAGALWSTGPDLGRYMQTLLAGGVTPEGERVVTRDGLERLWSPQVDISADLAYGLGWMVGDHDGLRLVTHGGNTLGFTSDLTLLPEAELGVSVVANAGNANPFVEAVRQRVIERVFDQEPSFDAQATFARESMLDQLGDLLDGLDAEAAADALGAHLGRWTNPDLGAIDLRLDDGTVVLEAGTLRTRLWRDPEAPEGRFTGVDAPVMGLDVRTTTTDEGDPRVEIVQGPTRYAFVPVDGPVD
ncbi:MAG: serine hydrolase domain-containing protein [Trueperaceae bacterium]